MTQPGDARQHHRPGRRRRAGLREVPATDQAIRQAVRPERAAPVIAAALAPAAGKPAGGREGGSRGR
jgi:hypothetical protein